MLRWHNMARILVIGAGGQVAADLVPALDARGDDLTLVDRVPPEQTATWEIFHRHFHDRPRWTESWKVMDASQEPADYRLISETRPDVVYHLAAMLSARCEQDPAACWRANMALFRNVLQDLAEVTTDDYRPKLLWPSSIAAFGPPPGNRGGYVADNEYPLLPQTMYGVSKVASEVLGNYYADRHGVDFRSVRFPGLLNTAPPGGGSSDYANAMYFGAVEGSEPVCFVRPQARIPFMYMADAVKGLIALADAEESRLTRRVYNITSFAAPTAEEIAASIAREIPGFRVRYEPDERQEYVDSWPDDFDDAPARDDWGWRPGVADLDAMTRRLLADIRAVQPQTT